MYFAKQKPNIFLLTDIDFIKIMIIMIKNSLGGMAMFQYFHMINMNDNQSGNAIHRAYIVIHF